jgi:hypothetical protein
VDSLGVESYQDPDELVSEMLAVLNLLRLAVQKDFMASCCESFKTNIP